MLRRLFPGWTLSVTSHGIWRAEGPMLISVSSCEGLIRALADADPEALTRAATDLDLPTP
ncbi:hypothetical protein [Actinomadura rupiterrae]|uniref:hypothetical protein n=1 Tax=Actinomadura rupiterrae TaxID=559627 RepID=UPI0020A4DAC3|nr:hypothetical protein [Actinomadura rupiterrae]MCP2342542.1 hypothetical protein [Actinomadura rupiterrae]